MSAGEVTTPRRWFRCCCRSRLRRDVPLRRGEGDAGETGPGGEGGGDHGIGLGSGEDWAEVALVGEVLDGAIGPDQGWPSTPAL